MSFGPRPWIQQHWDIRAAANFVFGGTGAGLLVAWALLSPAAPAGADWRLFALGGIALIGAGLGAVWLEIGRKMRAVHVFFNPRTSWMTREAFVALVVFLLVVVGLFLNAPGWARAGAFAALVFVWCQGRILQASKGIPAWRLQEVVPLVITTGLAEGTGLYLLAQPGPLGATLLGLAVIARALAWSRYRSALQASKARAALEGAGRLLVQLGTIVPLALALASYFTPYAGMLAGVAALAAGWILKFTLVTRASYNQGFALPRLPVRGAR